MSRVAVLWLLAAAAAGAPADEKISYEEYRSRRSELRNSLKDGVIILFGRAEKEHGDLRSGFFQEPNFYYLTGWREPGAMAILTAEGETLFLPRRNPEAEKWTGRKISPEDENLRALTGFDEVQPSESFEAQLPEAIRAAAKVYTLTDHATSNKLQTLLALREIHDAAPAIARLRMKKSPVELEQLRRSAEITMEAHRAAWKRMTEGLHEYQLAATITGHFLEKGCERPAFAAIVGSGANGAVLHYSRNRGRLKSGELVVIDVGAECGGYAADVTRTVPVNGKFDARQKELYRIVLGAQKAALAAVKPGMTLGKTTPNSLYQIAYDYIDSHGKDKHGQSLGRYFTHGLGHHVGLDVHDANDPAMALAPGMVITIEPGIYIPEEGIGIRIEDMVLVTENGGQLLTGALARETDGLERALRK